MTVVVNSSPSAATTPRKIRAAPLDVSLRVAWDVGLKAATLCPALNRKIAVVAGEHLVPDEVVQHRHENVPRDFRGDR